MDQSPLPGSEGLPQPSNVGHTLLPISYPSPSHPTPLFPFSSHCQFRAFLFFFLCHCFSRPFYCQPLTSLWFLFMFFSSKRSSLTIELKITLLISLFLYHLQFSSKCSSLSFIVFINYLVTLCLLAIALKSNWNVKAMRKWTSLVWFFVSIHCAYSYFP